MGEVSFSSAEKVDLNALRMATKGAGFELKWAEVEATGTLSTRSVEGTENLSLRLENRNQNILLVPGDGDETRSNYSKLSGLSGESIRVRLRGRAHSHQEGLLALSISRFERLGP